MTALRFENLHGPGIAARLDALASLRIEVFREWPYLYDGSLEYEREYLNTYIVSSCSLASLVFDGRRLVGATTALPMIDEEPEFRQPVVNAGFDPAKVFYFGESILLPEYRGRGLGHRFFREREKWARAHAGITHTCFCAVQRPDEHPARPIDYTPLDEFWRGRGYQRRDDIVAYYAWRDLGETQESEKPLVFWFSALK